MVRVRHGQDEWHVDMVRAVDADGWEYAFDFDKNYLPVKKHRHFVRRRRHIRYGTGLRLPLAFVRPWRSFTSCLRSFLASLHLLPSFVPDLRSPLAFVRP